MKRGWELEAQSAKYKIFDERVKGFDVKRHTEKNRETRNFLIT